MNIRVYSRSQNFKASRKRCLSYLRTLIVGFMEERKDLIKLGNTIKNVRESMKLTQEQFAKKCGLSKTYIGMLERGERNPSYLTLQQIASKIVIDIHKLIP